MLFMLDIDMDEEEVISASFSFVRLMATFNEGRRAMCDGRMLEKS